MSLRLLPLVLGLLLVPLSPPAQAQLDNPTTSTPTTLYFHIFDTLNLFPINTQEPKVEFFRVGGNNFPSIASQGFNFNTIRGFATSGPVEYDFIENGQPRFHPERGIARDILLDEAVTPMVYLYLNVRDFIGTQGLPNVLPTFTFDVTIREGNAGTPEELDANPILMQGSLTAHVVRLSVCPEDVSLTYPVGPPAPDPRVPACGVSANENVPAGPAPDGLPILVADSNGTVEFAFPLPLAAKRIPKADAYNVRIDWYQNPTGNADQDGEFAEGFMRLVSDPTHHPRIEMAILNPVYIEYIHPQVAAGILLVHTCVNSPWGTYDVDVASMGLEIEGPTQPQEIPVVTSQNAHVHGLHDECAEVTYLWRFREEKATDGSYALQLNVPNLAGTAVAQGGASFQVEGKKAFGIDQGGNVVEPNDGSETKSSPGPALGLVATLLAVALFRRRGVA